MDELWLPVPGLKGFYEISNIGRLRRSAGGGPNAKIGKIRALVPDRNGYQTCCVYLGDSMRCLKMHRLVVEAFIGEIPGGMQVNHKNGIKSDNRVENLEIVTPSQNTKHGYDALGRKGGNTNPTKGESHHHSRFTEADIRQIRSLYEAGITQVDIATCFLAHQGTISAIVLRKTWKHVA